jgi:hypothetical protein
MSDYPPDWMDGRQVPAFVVDTDTELIGTHQGSVWVKGGCTLELLGILQGSLNLEEGAQVNILQTHQGSLHVSAGSHVSIIGKQQGSVHIDPGGLVTVEEGGVAAGSVHNDGRFEIKGTRGGTLTGTGETEVYPGAVIKQPRLIDGM